MWEKLLRLREWARRRARATPKRKLPLRPPLSLEALEERWCPAATDTLIFNPQGGSTDGTLAANYYDQTLGQQGVQAPTANSPIILTASGGRTPNANSPIEFKAATPVKSITVQAGYQSTMTIDNGAPVSTSANDTIQNGATLTLVSMDARGIQLSTGAGFSVLSGGTLNVIS